MTTETAETIELPEKLFILLIYYEALKLVGPLFIPFGDVGFGCPVFGERELAEEFLASDNFDAPARIHEITLENFIAAGEYPIDHVREHGDEREYVYMVDPRPMHEWNGLEGVGDLYPMAATAKVLREALAE
jgi:hypothetical protein